MRADGPYGTLPLSDPAEEAPSESALRQTRRPRDSESRANRMTPNPSSPGFMGMEQRQPQGGLPRRANAARQRARVHERAVTGLLKLGPAPEVAAMPTSLPASACRPEACGV
jgi:hypothetical protein